MACSLQIGFFPISGREMLKKRSKIKGGLTQKRVQMSGLLHNLNNLLGVIVSQGLILKRKLKDETLSHQADLICRTAMEASEFVERLRNPRRHHRALKREWVDINDVLTQVIHMTRPYWQAGALKQNGSIEVSKQFKELPKLYISASALREIFMNIMLNAIDALTKKGGGIISIRSSIDGKFIKILISDSGIGMSQKTLRQAFRPFFTTKGSPDRGLGLTTAAEIIKKYEGTLSVKSVEGVGTTFAMAFPVPKGALARYSSNLTMLPVTARKVMLVDDEDDYRRATADLLSLEGYEVEQARDGREALERLKRKRFDVVLSDVRMPGVSGPHLIQKIKEGYPNTKVILFSGEKPKSTDTDGHADGWLLKPCMVEDIREAIERACQ